MPSQTAEIHETILALRRALRREKEAASDEPISSATNRGNKLKKGASYVHSGALPYPHGPDGHKQQIVHAGYTRYILDRNPRRYNDFGDELEDEESDADADAEAEEQNPYSGVRLEELLCPLKHPAELAEHPTLSIPFLDSALPNIVQTTEEKLRQERANLWRAKNLHRQLIGDENWMPCKSIETADDWDLFEPRSKAVEEQRRKRKRDEIEPMENCVREREQEHAVETNGDKAAESIAMDGQENAETAAQSDKRHKNRPVDTGQEEQPVKPDGVSADVEMLDTLPATNGGHTETSVADQHNKWDQGEQQTNGETEAPPENGENEDPASDAFHSQSPPPPSRRITRALAAENAPTPPLSPSPSLSTLSSSLLTPDPLFLLPHQANRSTTLLTTIGLPIDELLETRRLLSMYIQKQEETIRSTEAVVGKLIKAKRLKDKVWEWCKAEGHVGELSDGEDWIDGKEWGLGAGELRKGKDEEDGEDEMVGVQGKKGRRRRVRARDGGD